MPPKPLQRVLVVICVIRWEPAANERAWLRACQVEVGSGAFRRTARTEEEEHSWLLLLQPKSCAAPGREKQRWIVFGRKEGEKERKKENTDRKDSQNPSLSVVPGVSRFCLHASGPLNTDVSGPPQSGCSAAPPAKPN